MIKRLLPLLLTLGLTGCSGIDLLNALAPRAGIVVTRDLAYGEGSRRGLDVYAPAHAAHAPVVVFFYGGGWTSGAKAQYRFLGATLAAKGIVTIIPDYRLFPEVAYPAFIQDGAAAVTWARANAARYGGDANKLFVFGHSAGAYIAMMLAIDPAWLAPYAMVPQRDLEGAIGISGPYDFLPLDTDQLRAIFAAARPLSLSQPINYVRADAKNTLPPVLLIAGGSSDHIVSPGNTDRLGARIKAAGGDVTVRIHPNLNHELSLGAIATPLTWLAPVQTEVTGFIFREAP